MKFSKKWAVTQKTAHRRVKKTKKLDVRGVWRMHVGIFDLVHVKLMSSSFEVMHCKIHNQSTEAYGTLVYVFGVTWLGIKPRPPAPRADTLTTMLCGGSPM